MNFPKANLDQSVGSNLRRLTASFADKGIQSARLDSLILLEYVTAKPRSWLLAHPEHSLRAQETRLLAGLATRRAQREPIAYITGSCEFYGLNLKVNTHTLIPRPETEGLVDRALSILPKSGTVLDVGTGSGAIALALRSKRPDVQITASDISRTALQVAQENANNYSMDDIIFIESNLMDDIVGIFDVVIANLPYLDDERVLHDNELGYEPASALYSPSHGLQHISDLIEQIASNRALNKGGSLLLETDLSQHTELTEHAKHYGFTLQFTQGLVLHFINDGVRA